MSVPLLRSRSARLFVVAFAVVSLVFSGAGLAAAHTEATVSEGAQAGAGPVTVTFNAAAESDTAGITGAKTQLPTGITPGSVALVSGPDGWILAPTADGYEVTGPAPPPGADAQFAITIARLPADQTELVFKTLLRYSDGSEDAWIEVPTPDVPEPVYPAPTITVAPAAARVPGAPTSSSAAPAPTESTPPASPAAADPAPAAQESSVDESRRKGFVAAIAVLVVAAIAGPIA